MANQIRSVLSHVNTARQLTWSRVPASVGTSTSAGRPDTIRPISDQLLSFACLKPAPFCLTEENEGGGIKEELWRGGGVFTLHDELGLTWNQPKILSCVTQVGVGIVLSRSSRKTITTSLHFNFNE